MVVTDSECPSNAFVLSVSTGTKCINGEHLSMNGTRLNDCHAEIVSRRCTMYYLFHQLDLYAEWQAQGEYCSVHRVKNRRVSSCITCSTSWICTPNGKPKVNILVYPAPATAGAAPPKNKGTA